MGKWYFSLTKSATIIVEADSYEEAEELAEEEVFGDDLEYDSSELNFITEID